MGKARKREGAQFSRLYYVKYYDTGNLQWFEKRSNELIFFYV